MIWLWSAVMAHTANAAVFVADKGLLKSQSVMGSPARYAFFSGLSAGVAIVLLPWVKAWPSGFIILWSSLSGLFHLAALWTFYMVLQQKESSRVVPLVGAAVPIWTLVLAALFLGERLSALSYWGSIAVIVGGILLSFSWQHRQRISSRDLVLIITSGLLFAAYFTAVKFLYDNSPTFLLAFMYGRVCESVLALALIGSWLKTRQPKKKEKRINRRQNIGAGIGFIGNKGLAAGAFMLQSYAIRLGSVSIVNALQGVQYLALLVLAAIASLRWPKIYQEELSRVSLVQKMSGIIVISLGMAMLVYA